MSNKFEFIKKAVFYAHEKPEDLAALIAGVVSDVATSIAISGANSIEIPTGEASNTETYTAKVLSQYGDEVVGQTATFTLKSSVTGVSISGGVVTVAKTATGKSFTLVATCGTVTAEKTVALIAAE